MLLAWHVGGGEGEAGSEKCIVKGAVEILHGSELGQHEAIYTAAVCLSPCQELQRVEP